MRISDWSSDVCSSDLRYEAKQCDIRGNRDSYIGAGIFGFITLIELAGVLTVIPRAHRPAERTPPWLHSNGKDRKSVVVGKECVSTCRSRWSPDHLKKKEH